MIEGSSTHPGERQSRNINEEARRKQREDQLDRDLADTFPASDPPAQISKGTISRLIKRTGNINGIRRKGPRVDSS